MSELQRAISVLAEQFATQVLAAIRSASLGDIAALTGGAPKRGGASRASAPVATRGRGGRKRRNAADFEALGERIVEVVRANAEGIRAEGIREALGVPRKELPRVLSLLIDNGSLTKSGQKRATTYFAAEGGGAPRGKRGAKRAGKRGGKRRAKKAA